MYVFLSLEYIHEDFFNFRKTSGPIPHNPALSHVFLRLHSRQLPPRGWGNREEVTSLLVPRLNWWDRGSTWSDTKTGVPTALSLACKEMASCQEKQTKKICFPFPFFSLALSYKSRDILRESMPLPPSPPQSHSQRFRGSETKGLRDLFSRV